MELPADFFAEFPAVSKADWLARVARDLKGKPLDELYWRLSAGVVVDPFGHADDFPTPPAPLSAPAPGWEITEDVSAADPAAANAEALEALEGGAEGLRFSLPALPSADDLRRRLGGIYLDFIGLHFAGTGVAQTPGAVLGALEQLARERSLDPRALRGSLAWDPAASAGLQDWRYLAELLDYGATNFPHFRLVTVAETAEFQGAEHAADALAALLRRGNLYLGKLAERGVAAAGAAAQIQFSVAAGTSYFVEIAKLRAFRLLWLNVLKAWGAPPVYPLVEARFSPEAYTGDLYDNLIRATTMAMSAVLGGAQRLTVLPCDAGHAAVERPPAFGRRMARNVQHLLKMESFFAETADPAAGSYYVEKLTVQLAETAWAKFQARPA